MSNDRVDIKTLCPVFGQHEDVDVPLYAHVKEVSISYSDAGKELFYLPPGARILFIAVDVTTGFNGTTPTYDIGYKSGDTDAVVDGGTLASAAARSLLDPPAATIGEWNNATGGVLVGTFAGGGGNTAGAGVLKIAYYTPY